MLRVAFLCSAVATLVVVAYARRIALRAWRARGEDFHHASVGFAAAKRRWRMLPAQAKAAYVVAVVLAAAMAVLSIAFYDDLHK